MRDSSASSKRPCIAPIDPILLSVLVQSGRSTVPTLAIAGVRFERIKSERSHPTFRRPVSAGDRLYTVFRQVTSCVGCMRDGPGALGIGPLLYEAERPRGADRWSIGGSHEDGELPLAVIAAQHRHRLGHQCRYRLASPVRGYAVRVPLPRIILVPG